MRLKAKAPCLLSEATSLVPSGVGKVAFNSCKDNTLCAYCEAKASSSKALLSSVKTASPSEAKTYNEAILASQIVQRKASKAKSKAS